MSDAQLRELERAAHAGDPGARQALFLAERRAGFPNTRDPRKDPRPGDRLRRRDGIYEVRAVFMGNRNEQERSESRPSGSRSLTGLFVTGVCSRKVLTPRGRTSLAHGSGFDTNIPWGMWSRISMVWKAESRSELEGTCGCGHAASDHADEILFWACLKCKTPNWVGFSYPCNGFGPWQENRVASPAGPVGGHPVSEADYTYDTEAP